MQFYSEGSLLHVIFLTFVLGCGCAWLTGRAIASSWRPAYIAAAAMVPVGFALRFLHFALFQEQLLEPVTWIFETACLIVVALVSWRYARAGQMVRQYYWLYEPAGPLSWRPRQNDPAKGAS
jgi:Na+/H+-dicarboxylate symporter